MWFFNKIVSISPKELEKRLNHENIYLIDVRQPNEYLERHIKQAKNIPYEEIDQFNNPNYQAPLYIICKSGVRSVRAAKKLKRCGYKVINVLKGMDGYQGKTVSTKN